MEIIVWGIFVILLVAVGFLLAIKSKRAEERLMRSEMEMEESQIEIYVPDGGRMPKRETDGAIGHDAAARAVVSGVKDDKDPERPYLRRTLFDFVNMPDDPKVRSHVHPGKKEGQLVYRLAPRERVLVGIGFVTAMKMPQFYWVCPRSGLASTHGITFGNAPGTIDSDYRGEAGVVLINNGEEPFDLEYGMRIAQVIFQPDPVPRIVEVKTHEELSPTKRGTGGFGSTGV